MIEIGKLKQKGRILNHEYNEVGIKAGHNNGILIQINALLLKK